MKTFNISLVHGLLVLLLLTAFGCEKKEENQKPTVSFLQPDSNLTIDNDTLLVFIVDPFDRDGTIDRVEFTDIGKLVHTAFESPWTYEWNLLSEESKGFHVIKATAYDNQGASGEAEISLEVKSYLSKWAGSFEGTSHHWIGSPQQVHGEWQYVVNHYYNEVLAEVSLSSQDSCLDFTFTYNDTEVFNNYGLKFLPSGTHYSNWGGGSSYGYLQISFETDSLHYNKFQKCGIPCNSGIDFIIGKK